MARSFPPPVAGLFLLLLHSLCVSGDHLFIDQFHKCLNKCNAPGAAPRFVDQLIGVLEEAKARTLGTSNNTEEPLCSKIAPFRNDLSAIHSANRERSDGPVSALYGCVRQFSDKNSQHSCPKAGRCLVLFSTLIMHLDGVVATHTVNCLDKTNDEIKAAEGRLRSRLKTIGDELREHVVSHDRLNQPVDHEEEHEHEFDYYGGHGYEHDHDHDHGEEP